MTHIICHRDPLWLAYLEGKEDRKAGCPIIGNPHPRSPRSEVTAFTQWELGWAVEDAAIREGVHLVPMITPDIMRSGEVK